MLSSHSYQKDLYRRHGNVEAHARRVSTRGDAIKVERVNLKTYRGASALVDGARMGAKADPCPLFCGRGAPGGTPPFRTNDTHYS